MAFSADTIAVYFILLVCFSIALILFLKTALLNPKSIVYLFFAFVPVFLVIQNVKSLFDNILPGIKAARLIDDIFILVLFILWLNHFLLNKIRVNPLAFKKIFVLFAVYFIFNSLYKYNGYQTLAGLRTYLVFPLLSITVLFGYLTSCRENLIVFKLIIFSSLLMIPLALVELFVFESLGLKNIAVFNTRLSGFMGNPNLYAYMLAYSVFLMLILFKTRLKYLVAIVAILFILPSGSRSTLLGLFVVLAINMTLRGRIDLFLIATIGGVAGLVIIGAFFDVVVFERLFKFFEEGDMRFNMWASIIEYMSDQGVLSLLFGIGVGRIGTYAGVTYSLPINVPGLNSTVGDGGLAFVDNQYLTILLEHGIVGLLIWVVLAIFCIIMGVKNLGYSVIEDQLIYASISIMVFIVTISFFVESWYSFPHGLFYWFSVSCIFIISSIQRPSGNGRLIYGK